jgi:hypothetical protein
MKTQKLPRTDSISELAQFWDTHDLTDFENELEEVKEPVFVRRAPLKVHLQSSEARVVEKIAQAKGVSQEDLIREWVVEKLTHWNGDRPKKQQASNRPARRRGK